jgi:hypothetical protein
VKIRRLSATTATIFTRGSRPWMAVSPAGTDRA